jgi:hypothetical protein
MMSVRCDTVGLELTESPFDIVAAQHPWAQDRGQSGHWGMLRDQLDR